MARFSTFRRLILLLAILGFQPHFSVAQTAQRPAGPAVQVFTSNNSGASGQLRPFDRPINVTASINTGYDTNVSTDPNAQGSFFTDANVSLSYVFGTPRFQGTLSTSAGFSYYNGAERSGFNYTPNLGLALGMAYGVSERLSLTANVYAKYGIEPDFSVGTGLNRRSGNFFYSSTSLSASYLWLERFSTVTSYSLSFFKYEDDFVASYQDRFEHGIGQQLRFLLLPATTLVGEYRLGLVTYDSAGRDSSSNYLLIGIDDTLGPHIQLSVKGGAEFRHSDIDDSNTATPYLDGSLSYVIGAKTSLNFTVRYSTIESDVLEASSRTSLRAGLQATYGLTARIDSSLSVYYLHDENQGTQTLFIHQPSFNEDSLDLGLNFRYAVNPRLSANAGYQHTEILSDFSQRSYSRSRYFGGISYSF